jgi:hypothetical protein
MTKAGLAKPLGKGRLRDTDFPGQSPGRDRSHPTHPLYHPIFEPFTVFHVNPLRPRYRCIREGLLTAEGAPLEGSLGCPVQVTTILTLGETHIHWMKTGLYNT